MDLKNVLGIVNKVISLFPTVSDSWAVKPKTEALKRKTGMLSARMDDISFQLEQEERRPGKRRRSEVDAWMQSAGPMVDQAREVERQVYEGSLFSRLMAAAQVSVLSAEVDKWHEKGRFDDGLTLDVKPARGYELRPGELMGQASETKRDEIWDCLMNEETLRVGVWGEAGVGKTFLAEHVHDQIVRDCPRFDGACLVTVSKKGTVGTIQTDIAKYLKLDLTEVSCVYWGARLKEALQGRKLLLILDDVGKNYSLEEVGIPLETDGCKLIVTSRSSHVCVQMKCHELVHVATLPGEIP